MNLHVVFKGSIAKHDLPDCVNEDCYNVDEAGRRCCVSDGAGQSYAPALWSGILTRAWLGQARLFGSREQLGAAIRRFDGECDVERLSWSRTAAYQRGTFATLLGIRLRGDRLRAVALGDSQLLIIHPDGRLDAFPYDDAEAFDQSPMLVSTLPSANRVFTLARLKESRRSWRVTPGTRIMLMTDALGRWLLSRGADAESRSLLAELRTEDDLKNFVRVRQADGSLKVDDCTLIHLLVENA
jgi:Protein phosphatase 2C